MLKSQEHEMCSLQKYQNTNKVISWYSKIYDRSKFHTHASLAWKRFITWEPRVIINIKSDDVAVTKIQ